MFTYKILRKDDSGSLFVRVIKDRKKAEFKLGVSATQEEFGKASKLSSAASKQRLACYLRNIVGRLDAIKLDYAEYGIDSGMTVGEVRDRIRSEILFLPEDKKPKIDDTKLFIPFFRRCIESKTNAGYRENRTYTLKKICEYCKDADKLTFDDIDLKWLNRFDEWLVGQGLKQNSRNIHFKNIRTVINRAIDEELTDKYPFRRFKIRPEATRKRNLPVEELRKLFSCEVEEYQVIYRDMAKLMFMLCGINAVDLFNLEDVTSDGRVEYRRAKTHRLYSIKVEPEAMEIIDKYRGETKLLNLADRWRNHEDFTKWLNKALKKIGVVRIVGRGGKKDIRPYWPDISSYWMRHSWATIAYNDLDIPKDVIAQGLGHGKNDVTETYIRRDERKIDEANRRILDWVLYSSR